MNRRPSSAKSLMIVPARIQHFPNHLSFGLGPLPQNPRPVH